MSKPGLSLELRGLDEMQRELETLSKRAMPWAARETLDGLAFEGRKIWLDEMRASLNLRNQFTTRRVRVERARGFRMSEMEAVLGHPENYVRRLEFGIGSASTWGGEGVAIPTETAAGQAKGTLSSGRKSVVRKALLLRSIGKVRRVPKSVPRKARNARAVRDAIRNGTRIAYLEFSNKRGLYRIVGGRKNPDIRKLYDLTKTYARRPRKATLQRTIDRVMLMAPKLAIAAVQRQLDRHRIGSAREWSGRMT